MIEVADGEVRSSESVQQNHYRGLVHLPSSGEVVLRQFWFPGWEAAVDGAAVPTSMAGLSAVVSCHVPAGDHTVEFHYRSLPQRRAGILISLSSLFLIIGALLAGGLWRRTPEDHPA
jgi:hypothetical protein